MPDDESWFEEGGDELRDDEYPDDEMDNDATTTVACPHCGAEIYEDAVCCPVCGEYITNGVNALGGWPRWWILLGLAGSVATLLVLAGFRSC